MKGQVMTRSTLSLALAFSMLAFVGLGCKKKEPKDTTDAAKEVAKTDTREAPEAGQGLPDPGTVETMTLERVHFDLDQHNLTQEAKDILGRNAEILREHPSVKVRVEGHCDERGTTEYNLALGEKRASAVRDYLVNLGVASTSLITLSLGEEKPLEHGSTEAAYRMNRRAEMVVIEGSDNVVGSAN